VPTALGIRTGKFTGGAGAGVGGGGKGTVIPRGSGMTDTSGSPIPINADVSQALSTTVSLIKGVSRTPAYSYGAKKALQIISKYRQSADIVAAEREIQQFVDSAKRQQSSGRNSSVVDSRVKGGEYALQTIRTQRGNAERRSESAVQYIASLQGK
jgi:hypothetical protein